MTSGDTNYPMNRECIVLADDDRLILATLSEGLRNAGFTVIEAADGAEAVKLSLEHGPDLAILDVRMPNLSGIEAAQKLKEATDIPFLFLTAYGEQELVKTAVDEGALGYLVKPMDVPQVIPAVEAALARAAELKALKERESHLTTALSGGRETSMAVGLIMERYRLDRRQAFEALRFHARSQRRKMSLVAAEMLQAAEAVSLPADVLAKVSAQRN